MKTFLFNIIPEIKKYSKELDSLTLLCEQNWVVLDENAGMKVVYIFRKNGQLLISLNGNINKGNWEFIQNNIILIEISNESFMFRNEFFDENILILKKDGNSESIFFINESKYKKDINSLLDLNNFLNEKYLKTNKKHIGTKDESILIQEELIFTELEELREYDFMNGTHYSIQILFNNSLKGIIYRGGNSGKYFLEFGFSEIVYFDNKMDCIKYLYKKLNK